MIVLYLQLTFFLLMNLTQWQDLRVENKHSLLSLSFMTTVKGVLRVLNDIHSSTKIVTLLHTKQTLNPY